MEQFAERESDERLVRITADTFLSAEAEQAGVQRDDAREEDMCT